MYFLEVSFQGTNTTRRWVYDSFEEAQEQLNLLAPKIGKDPYNTREKDEDRVHTIKSKCGDGVVVPRLIVCAGITIDTEWKKARDRQNQEWLELAKKCKAEGIELPK